MKRHITRVVAFLMTLMMILTSVPSVVLPVFASAVSGTTTNGEEALEGFDLRASEATLGKDIEYYALGESTYINHTDGVIDNRLSAYEPFQTTNALDPFLVGGDAWINLDNIYYGAPAMPNFAISKWSANTSVVNTTYVGYDENGAKYTFPDMDLINETLWGKTLINFPYNTGEDGEANVNVDIEGVVSSKTSEYLTTNGNGAPAGTTVLSKNGVSAYAYNRYDDMQGKWGITADKNVKRLEFTPVNTELFLSKTPYLYFSNEQTDDTKMAISLLIGTPVIDTTKGTTNGIDDPGVVHVYEKVNSSLNGKNPGKGNDVYYAKLAVGDMFKSGSTYTYIDSASTLSKIVSDNGLTDIKIDGKTVNVKLYQNRTMYKTDSNGDYIYEYKWYTVTDNLDRPGVKNDSRDFSMIPSVTISGVATADGKVGGADYVVPEAGYVTGAVTGCIDFVQLLDTVYSYDYTGVKYDVAKVRVDMADKTEGRRNAGRINYIYFAPACEDTFTPQVNAGVVESEDNALAEGWENGACVTIVDTPNNQQVITIDTTGSNGKPVYYDNELQNNYKYYGNGKTLDEYKASHPEKEDIDYVTVKIPVQKYVNALSDARKFTMTVDVLSWATADGGSTTNPSQAIKRNNGEVATPTIMLWGSRNGAVGFGRHYWLSDTSSVSDATKGTNLGCRFANDGILAVLGNGVYLAEPHYWYNSATVDRTLGNSTDYDGAESWYDLLRSPYMYDETITNASGSYTQEMVGYVYITNITVCVPKGTVLTIKEARCSGNSAGMNMQDDVGDVVHAYDGGAGVNPVVNENVTVGETNLTGDVVKQSGVNFSDTPAAYGPYLTFSDYTIGKLIDTSENRVLGRAFRDYKDTGNDKFHDAIYPVPKATYGNVTYSYQYNGATKSVTVNNDPIGKIFTESSSVASYMVYASVEFDNGQKFGAVGVIRDTIQNVHDGDKYISDIGWVCLRTKNSDGTYKYLAEQGDYRTGIVYDFGKFADSEAFLAAHPQWKQDIRNEMIDNWVYSDLGGYGSFHYYDKDGKMYDAAGHDAEYLTNDKAPDGNMLVEDYWLVDNNGSSVYDSSGNYQWRYAPTLFNANQWRGLGGANTYYQVAAYKNGALKPGNSSNFSDTELHNGVHNFELTYPYEFNNVDETGVDHRGHMGDWSEFRAKLKSDANTSIGMTRTLEKPIMVRIGQTSSSTPALYYDLESTASSAVFGLLVAMPRKNAYGNTAYDDIQLWYISASNNTLRKSIPIKNFLGDGKTNSNPTHSGDQDSARNSISDENHTSGYISLADLLNSSKGGSTTDRCYIVGVTQSMWHGTGSGEVKTTVRRLEVMYEADAWLDDINYGTVTDTTSIPASDKNINLLAPKNTSDAALKTEHRSDGTILLTRTAADTGQNMGYAADHHTTIDLSRYRYLHLTVNSEVPWLISMSESVSSNAWHSIGSTEAIRSQVGESNFTTSLSGGNTSVKAGKYRLVIDLHKVPTLGARDYKLAMFFIELHGTGRLAISEMVFSEKSTCTAPFPNLDTTYTYNIHDTRNTTRTIMHDSFNILNDAYYYNQEYDVNDNTVTVKDTGKRGWTADLRTRGYNYYSDGTDNDPGTTQSAMQVIQNGGVDGLYQYKTSLGHLRMWTNPGEAATLVLNCDRTWDIHNYRYLYYSYSMRDDKGIAVEDEPNGSGIQLVLKTTTQNSGAAFVDCGDTWEYHTNYNTNIWQDNNTNWNDNIYGAYGTTRPDGKTNEKPTKANQCQCSKCLNGTGAKEPERSYNVSANAAVDLYDVYNQEVELSGAMNYKNTSSSTRTEPAETAINQIVFYIQNNLSTDAEFYINYIYLSNTPISDEMQPILEMEEHQYYYLMDNTGSRYSARFPTLDNPTGQITGLDSTMQGGTAYRTQTRNNPVLVKRGDILEEGMFVNGQDFNEITDYVSMAPSKAEAGSDKLWLKDGITMTEAVWFYENHFDEKIDGEQSAAPDQDILDYYKYIKADGSDGDVYDLQWSLGRWYTGEGTDGLNVMKKDESTDDVTGNLMKRYAVDNRVLLRTGIRPKTYTTYYDTDGGAMLYKGSSEGIKNGSVVNVDNYYITESTLNFFYTFPVDGSDMIEPYKPGYEFDGWEMMSDHGSQNPVKGGELRNYHAKDVAQVDYFVAKWKPSAEYANNTTAQNKAITAKFFRSDDGLKDTMAGTADHTWFKRETSWAKAFKLTLPSVSRMSINNQTVRVYGWEMVTYKNGTITRSGFTYNLGSTIWLLEDALFLPVLTPPEGDNGKIEEPTVTITLTNAELWTFVNGAPAHPVSVTGATSTTNNNTTTYVEVPRNALLVALPTSEKSGYVWHLKVDCDNVTQVSKTKVTSAVVGNDKQFVFAANGDYTLTYTTDAQTTKKPVVVQTNPSTAVENREMKFYSQFSVDETVENVEVVACGTLYTKAGSNFNSIADDLDGNMRINLSTVNATSAQKGSYQTVNTTRVRHAMQDLSVLSANTHQYYLMVTVKSGTATYYVRSYVIYKDSQGAYQAAYSDVLVSETIQADRAII